MYETGAGGVHDLASALSLYERACDGGLPAGCTRLQLMREPRTDVALPDEFLRVGWVADAQTGAPIQEAIVDLPETRLRVISDESGRVELGRLRRGDYRIVTQRAGYQTLSGELPVPWRTDFLVLLHPRDGEDPLALGRIFGRVTDEGRSGGLAAVEIKVLSPAESTTLTNQRGRFTLTGVEPGTVEISFERLGYVPFTHSLTVPAGKTVEVYVTMSALPIVLDPIIVTVGSTYLERSGFYRRAGNASGSRFTRHDIDVINPIEVSDLLSRAPGVTVQRGNRGAQVLSRRRVDNGDGTSCHLLPFLDGAPMFDWDLDLVLPSDIDGVEVYQGLGAPIQYRNIVEPDGTFPCGVVLIWTLRGR